jgi:hypothetical protein
VDGAYRIQRQQGDTARPISIQYRRWCWSLCSEARWWARLEAAYGCNAHTAESEMTMRMGSCSRCRRGSRGGGYLDHGAKVTGSVTNDGSVPTALTSRRERSHGLP